MLDLVQNNPGTSTQASASHVGISHLSVWRTLDGNNMHIYHIQRVPLLDKDDFAQ